jgi:hypothetical protein
MVAFLTACTTSTAVTKPDKGTAAGATTSSDAPATEETAEQEPPAPKPSDFDLRVKILKKECFGSAGCNVNYTIRVSYGGAPLPDDKDYLVTYKVTGGEQEIINTFTMTGDQAEVTQEESTSTRSSSAKLKAKVTEIE